MKSLSLVLICLALFVSCGKNKDSSIVSTSISPHVEKLLGSWKLQGSINNITGENIKLPDPYFEVSTGFYEVVFLSVKEEKFTLIKICSDPRSSVSTRVDATSSYSITENEIELYEDRIEIKAGCEVSIEKGKFIYSLSNNSLIMTLDPNFGLSKVFIRQ